MDRVNAHQRRTCSRVVRVGSNGMVEHTARRVRLHARPLTPPPPAVQLLLEALRHRRRRPDQLPGVPPHHHTAFGAPGGALPRPPPSLGTPLPHTQPHEQPHHHNPNMALFNRIPRQEHSAIICRGCLLIVVVPSQKSGSVTHSDRQRSKMVSGLGAGRAGCGHGILDAGHRRQRRHRQGPPAPSHPGPCSVLRRRA